LRPYRTAKSLFWNILRVRSLFPIFCGRPALSQASKSSEINNLALSVEKIVHTSAPPRFGSSLLRCADVRSSRPSKTATNGAGFVLVAGKAGQPCASWRAASFARHGRVRDPSPHKELQPSFARRTAEGGCPHISKCKCNHGLLFQRD
jgi:hypothetical protein